MQYATYSFICNVVRDAVLDYTDLIESAKQAPAAEADLEWVDSRQPLPRQHRALLGGAITGSVTYSGQLEPFLPLIHLCEQLHIGRQTHFGLGQLVCKEIY